MRSQLPSSPRGLEFFLATGHKNRLTVYRWERHGYTILQLRRAEMRSVGQQLLTTDCVRWNVGG